MKELYTDFIFRLKKLYGKYNADQKRFEKISNSEISRELGYSDAQFSRLIHNSATEKEYQRAIQNMDRILKIIQLESEKEAAGRKANSWKNHPVWLATTLLLVTGIIGFFIYRTAFGSHEDNPPSAELPMYYTLQWAFENSFITPYIKLDELPADGNYPSYRYQGKWELKNQYKIPLFREHNGYHYLATDVVLYAYSKNAATLEGYEYQRHEIWYDKRRWPIDSFLNHSNLRTEYQQLDLNKDSNFVKVAVIHTLFKDEFIIDSNKIFRSGKVLGRNIKFTSPEILKKQFVQDDVIKEIKSSLERISRNLLEDFSKPISCHPANVPDTDFHQIKDSDTMSYSCQLTTHRFPVKYTKTYILTDQYIKTAYRPLKK